MSETLQKVTRRGGSVTSITLYVKKRVLSTLEHGGLLAVSQCGVISVHFRPRRQPQARQWMVGRRVRRRYVVLGRQAEEMLRLRQDEMYRQLMDVHREAVVSYVDSIIDETVEK